jgi:CheY-like chemotaxis protein
MIIKGYSDLLLDTATPGARGYIEEIKNAGDRASALTRQLLAFSRKQVLEPQVLDPNQTVQGMIKMLRLLLGEDIDLVTHFSGKIGRVKVDPGQLEQVIMNLAVNARDAMPNGGKLIIATEQCDLDEDSAATHMEVSPGLFVLMSVTDTGSGMDKETQSHIFEPFFTTKEPGKGTGLGLATVYGIVKQSNGHIAVDSEPGRGTTFKVYLPSLEQSASLTAPPPAITAHRGNATILLVEDEAPLRALSSESLQRLGYTVLSAADGIEALEAVEKHPGRIDIVVTDIVMPHLGGKELVDTLRQKHSNFGVIFMSGYTESSLPETDTVSGGEVLLAKPFSSELLAQKVNEVLEAVNSNRKARAASV